MKTRRCSSMIQFSVILWWTFSSLLLVHASTVVVAAPELSTPMPTSFVPITAVTAPKITAEIVSCSGWALKRYPALRSFLLSGEAASYENVKVTFVHGRTAIMTIYNEQGVAQEKIVLHELKTKEALHAMMREKGFVQSKEPEKISPLEAAVRSNIRQAELASKKEGQLIPSLTKIKIHRKSSNNNDAAQDTTVDIGKDSLTGLEQTGVAEATTTTAAAAADVTELTRVESSVAIDSSHTATPLLRQAKETATTTTKTTSAHMTHAPSISTIIQVYGGIVCVFVVTASLSGLRKHRRERRLVATRV